MISSFEYNQILVHSSSINQFLNSSAEISPFLYAVSFSLPFIFQTSKWQAMSAGILKMPLVLRVSVGSKYGAQHSQDWTALCAHIPGLKVCFPATPWEAKGLMESALRGTNPVVFFESQRIYDVGEQFHEGGVPEERYEIEFGDVKNNK